MPEITIHVCNCGCEPKLVYRSNHKSIQVKCPNCKAGTHVRNNSVKAIEEWNGRFV